MTPTTLTWLNRGGLVALLIAAVAFPFVVSDPTMTTIVVFAMLYAGAASGWNIFSGYTGYIALGHAGYFGIGAYTLAIICNRYNVPGGYVPLLLVPIAGVVAALFAVPLGAVALRTRRHTFVVITIATFFILQLMSYNLRGLTNGSTGLDMPIPFQWSAAYYNTPFYLAALAVTLLALATSWYVRNSKYGLGLLAIRDDEDRARGLGVRTTTSKLTAFVISAFFVGMVGGIYGYYLGSVQPANDFNALFDVAIALMAFLGGLGTLTGPILGALVLETSQQYLTLQFPTDGLYLILFGALFLIVILLLPQGVVPSVKRLAATVRVRLERRDPTAAPPPTGDDGGGTALAANREGVPA